MLLASLQEFRAALAPKSRIGALDVGEKTIGIATSDRGWMIATPNTTIRRAKKFAADLEELKRIIAKEEINALVVGLPINMDGTEGPRCQSTRQFIENIDGTFNVPILAWDERMSTMAVTRTLLEADISRQKRAQVVDKLAASYILQGVLDAMR